MSTSATVNMFDLMELARAKPNAIALGLGDPDLPTPAHIVAAAKQAIDAGALAPAPPTGLPELRAAISRKLARDNGVRADPDAEILVTTGGQEALFLLIQALIEPGDEVLVPDPRYTSYDNAIELAGGRMVLVPTDEAHAFELDPDDVAKRITPRTKLLLLISPNNPTGGLNRPATVRRLAELAVERDLLVIADEIYEQFVYDGYEHLSVASLPGLRERTITLNGLSKTYAMTGWRIGYLAAPPELIRAVSGLKQMVNIQAPIVSQWAGVAALDGPQACVAEMREIYDTRRRYVMQAVSALGLSYGEPRGGLYLWINTGSTGLPSAELSYRLLRDGDVLILPGSGFGAGWDNYMRMTLLQPLDQLKVAIERLGAVLAAL
jgi:aminotransferase